MSAAVLERFNVTMPAEEVYPISDLGEGIVLSNRRTIELTVDFAATFLEDNAEFWVNDEKVDRKLGEPHVIHLAREMLAGNFRWEQVNLVVANLDGRAFRMNGQHTCWARIYADEQGLDKKTRCPVQLMRYNTATVQDARRLYASLDRGKSRTHGTVVNSHLLGSEEFDGYKGHHLTLLAQGLGQWLWPTSRQRSLHGADDRAYLMLKDHHRVALQVGEFIKESRAADFRHLKRAPTVAAMFETFHKAPQIASDFWSVIRDGIGLSDKQDPRWVLREYLKAAVMTGATHKASAEQNAVSQEEIYRACIHAWNAFRSQRRLKHLRISLSEDRPTAR